MKTSLPMRTAISMLCNDAIQDIVPLPPRLRDSAIRKALELIANGLRLHGKFFGKAAW